MTISSKKFSAYVGLDSASRKHDVSIKKDSGERKFEVCEKFNVKIIAEHELYQSPQPPRFD